MKVYVVFSYQEGVYVVTTNIQVACNRQRIEKNNLGEAGYKDNSVYLEVHEVEVD